MSEKGTPEESNNDEQTNKDSDSLFQQGCNAELARLAPFKDTTLQDLPMEVLEYILIKVIVMEVKSMKLAKCVWKEKSDLVINRLKAVNSHWSSMLTTDFFRNELHRTLDKTAQETIRLEILHQFSSDIPVFKVTAMRDEVFMIALQEILVYDRSNMAKVKDVIVPPQGRPLDVAGCNVSNCVYAVARDMTGDSMLRITKDDEHQFNFSPWITDLYLQSLPNISVSVNGNLIIHSLPDGENPASVRVYDANGCLLHRVLLSPDNLRMAMWSNAVQKSNGNLLLVSSNDGKDRELMEIDTTGRIERQYKSSVTLSCGVHLADTSGRLVIVEKDRLKLLDSELNPLDVTGVNLNVGQIHYSCERNEGICIGSVGYSPHVLTIFRFTEK